MSHIGVQSYFYAQWIRFKIQITYIYIWKLWLYFSAVNSNTVDKVNENNIVLYKHIFELTFAFF